MRKAKHIIGLPVFTVDTGKQVGTVKDMMIGSDWTLKKLVLEARSWLAAQRSVRAEDVVGIGEDAVTIRSADAIAADSDAADEEARPLADGDGKLFGLPVLTKSGDQMGMIEDVYFAAEVGIPVIGLELSEGFLSDLREGRITFPIPEHAVLGEDAVVVPSSSLQ
ncbi:hypothetical protein SD70_09635 [Gordoniibacillus kamchatkensis]|uniref:PRC-barrel domain-containing protein n=1 Tax=Gordoniibacillus kamchatkensis TaxID=1590651 RepID=A0ABR5AJG2_9BACL|nr:PRC-barrel domain-containing protein [Paenibacillus sp. VKM B-2647]KIL41062.1 hypothetical protein SD70_09635 [Paenibacillus sp. VKM B-2647]